MASIAFSDLITIVSVLVDDWYQSSTYQTMPAVSRPAPTLSPSEVLTILLTMDLVPFPSETGFLGFLRATHLEEPFMRCKIPDGMSNACRPKPLTDWRPELPAR